jgi:hypothetical protein
MAWMRLWRRQGVRVVAQADTMAVKWPVRQELFEGGSGAHEVSDKFNRRVIAGQRVELRNTGRYGGDKRSIGTS